MKDTEKEQKNKKSNYRKNKTCIYIETIPITMLRELDNWHQYEKVPPMFPSSSTPSKTNPGGKEPT